jgi:hypothetical protein
MRPIAVLVVVPAAASASFACTASQAGQPAKLAKEQVEAIGLVAAPGNDD